MKKRRSFIKVLGGAFSSLFLKVKAFAGAAPKPEVVSGPKRYIRDVNPEYWGAPYQVGGDVPEGISVFGVLYGNLWTESRFRLPERYNSLEDAENGVNPIPPYLYGNEELEPLLSWAELKEEMGPLERAGTPVEVKDFRERLQQEEDRKPEWARWYGCYEDGKMLEEKIEELRAEVTEELREKWEWTRELGWSEAYQEDQCRDNLVLEILLKEKPPLRISPELFAHLSRKTP